MAISVVGSVVHVHTVLCISFSVVEIVVHIVLLIDVSGVGTLVHTVLCITITFQVVRTFKYVVFFVVET